MSANSFESLSNEELLALEAACDAFEEDFKLGMAKAVGDYIQSGNPVLLKSIKEEFEKIRLGVKLVGSTQIGVEAVSNTLVGTGKLAANHLEAGNLIGSFRLLNRIGHGATAQVWKAHHLELARDVAIKIPHSHCRGILKRFERESKAVAKLRHPHIVSVHEIQLQEDNPFLVCDLIEGESLAESLEHREFSFQETTTLMSQIVDAVAYSHDQGVLHRDLKPQNILVDAQGTAFVTDFGLARILNADSELLTREGDILGTPAFMSPEQAAGKANVDQRTDVYSLGVILFQLLTGELPFRGNVQSIVHQILTQDPPSPRNWNKAIPRDLETICLKSLAKSPRNRFSSARELLAELQLVKEGKPIRSRPLSGLERARMWVSRNKWVSLATGVACLLLLGLAIGGWAFGLAMSSAHEEQLRLRMAAEASEKEAKTSQREKSLALDEALIQKAIAEQRAIEAENAFQLLGSVFQESEPVLSVLTGDQIGFGEPPSVENMFKTASQNLRNRFPGDPRTQSKLLDSLGNSSRSLGLFDTAASLFADAQKIRTKNKELYSHAEYEFQTCRNRFYVAQLLHDSGRLEEAKSEYLACQEELAHGRENDLLGATMDFQLGRLYLNQRNNAEAKTCFQNSIALRAKHLPHDSLLLRASKLGAEYCDAIDGNSISWNRMRKLIGNDGWSAKAARLGLNAYVLRKQKRLQEAIEKHRELTSFLREVLSESHQLFLLAMGDFASLLWEAGNYRDAQSVIEFTIQKAENVAPEHYLLRGAKLMLAKELHRGGENEKAIPLFEELLKGHEESKDAHEIRHGLVWSYLSMDRTEEAKEMVEVMLQTVEKRAQEDSVWVQFTAARVYEKMGDESYQTADQWAIESIERRNDLPQSGFWSRRLAIICLHHGRLELAEKYIRNSIELETQRFHAGHPRVANSRMTLARVLAKQKQHESAREEVEKVLAIRQKNLPRKSKLIVECQAFLASIGS